ncbi:hypothetical protein FED29_017865 [Aeromonas veronii]|nr:hypothetical protein [Aeromonas veronii]
MTSEATLLALLESREAEANAKAEWIAEWVEHNRPQMEQGQRDIDPHTEVAEANDKQACQFNEAFLQMLPNYRYTPLVQFILQQMETALLEQAQTAWDNHLAALHDAMSEEQFERYQHRSAA